MNKNKLYKSNKLAGKVVESVSGFGQNGSTFVSSLVKFTDGTSLRIEPVNNAVGEEVNINYEFPGAKVTSHGNLQWQANAEATSQNVSTETHATKTENPADAAAQTGGVSSPVSCSGLGEACVAGFTFTNVVCFVFGIAILLIALRNILS